MRPFGRSRIKRIFALAFILLVVIVMPVMAAVFEAGILVQETNATDYDMLGIKVPANVMWWADNGYIDSDGRDTRVKRGSIELPHMLQVDNVFFSDTVTGDSSTVYTLATGETAQDMYIVPGYGGYVTKKDDPALEPGDNFKIEFDGYVDTTQIGDSLLSKEGALVVYISNIEEITAEIWGGSTEILPTGTNDPDVAWTNDGNAIDDDTGTFAVHTAGIPGTSWSEYFEVTFGACSVVGGKYYIETSATSQQVDLDYYDEYDGSWHDIYQGVFTDNVWEEKTGVTGVSVTKLRLRIYNGDGVAKTGKIKEIHYFENTLQKTITVINVDSDEHNVVIDADTTNFEISVDGAVAGDWYDSVALGVVFVPDAISNWVLMSNAISYWEYYEYSVPYTPATTLLVNYAPNDIIRGIAYSTGTVTVTNGDATVVGAGGAAWTDEMAGGLFVSTDGVWYVIDSVTDATHLELTAVYGGGTLAAQSYNIYPRLPDLEGVAQDGMLTLGANPGGISINLDSFVIVDQPTEEGVAIATPEALDIVTGPGNMFLADIDMEMQNNEFYFFVNWLSGVSNIENVMLWWFLSSAIFVCVMALLQKYLRNVWITGFSGAAALWLIVAMGGLEWWIPVPVVIATLFVGFWKRSAEV